MLVVVPFMIYSYENFGHVYPRFQNTVDRDWKPLSEGTLEKTQLGSPVSLFFAYWVALPGFLTWPFFILMVIGAAMMLLDIILGFDLINKEPVLKKDLYIFLWAFDVLLMFSIVYSTTGFEFDPRFLMPMYPAAFIIASKGLFKVYSYIKRYNRAVAVFAVSAVLVWGVYANLAQADASIMAKKDTYTGEREAGLWVRDNTKSSDTVLTCNQQVVFAYYTDRVTGDFGSNVTDADRLIDEMHPKYVLLDIYHPNCAFNLAKESSHKLTPAYVSFVDQEKKQPAVIVYEVDYK